MPPKPNPTLYSVAKTFMWFAITSFILLVCLVAMVYLDYHREWKDWQKKFIALKVEKIQKELTETTGKIDRGQWDALTKQHAEAVKAMEAHRKDAAVAEHAVEMANTKAVKAKGIYQNLKQYQDSYRYFFEEYRRENDQRAAEYSVKLEKVIPELANAKSDLEAFEAQKEEADKTFAVYGVKEKELQKAIDKLVEDKTRVERRLEAVKPTLAKEILNAPMVDFIKPSLQIQQIVLDNLQDDYHFAKVQKVDRCTTCHLGIDQKGFENAPQPFRTHPKMELYLSATSPHPIEKFGCTSCHAGNGHSVSFTNAAHTPNSEEQAKEWAKKYHWEELESWDAKMLPMKHIEAACAKCHQNVLEVPKADKLNQGRKLAQTEGCLNCHKIVGMESHWKVGPDLEHVGSKLDHDWIVKWLQNPQDFRPSTKMPRIFHLSNTSTPQDMERGNAAIESIAAYLTKNSEPVELTKPPVNGDSAHGEKLVKDLGCLGCHSVGGIKAGTAGPELSGLGSKVTQDWLYTWLKNPKHYSKNTRMPSLRLSDQEAVDISAYLLSLKNESFESKAAPKAKPEVIDELILTSLQGTTRLADAKKELKLMSSEDKLQFLGKKSISHQGCYVCHSIKGFEDIKPIGAELTNEGHKDIHQFDFGFMDIEHSRAAFIHQKLKNPRIYDQGKEKDYYDKLRMPQFNLSDEEIDALTTFVLSLTEEKMPLEMQKRLDLKEKETEEGRLLVSKLNCNGCHALDGKNGVLRELTEDKGAAPPVLDGEGAKVHEKWLHEFLKSPTPIRPWLTVRMPTFDLTDEEAATLVHYFANLAHQNISYQGAVLPQMSPEKVATGKELVEKLQCMKCHQVNADSAAMGTSFLAPDLLLAKHRLKPEWVKQWLVDPQVLQEGTMMPTFFADGQTPLPDVLGGDTNAQIEAIRDYLYEYEADKK